MGECFLQLGMMLVGVCVRNQRCCDFDNQPRDQNESERELRHSRVNSSNEKEISHGRVWRQTRC